MSKRRIMVGRAGQLAALNAARSTAGCRFALVTGVPGSGRTTLLDAAAQAAEASGAVVLRVPEPVGHSVADGFGAVLQTVREQYERFADPLLSGPLGALGGRGAAGGLAALAEHTSAAFGLIGRRVPTVLVADDVDDTPGVAVALAAAARDGCLVIAAARRAEGRAAALADLVVDLPPLDRAAVGEMLSRRHGAPLDEAVPVVLAAALGPLAGHPATVAETADALVRAGRLTVAGGHLCLLDPGAPIALPAGHRLIRALYDRGPQAVRIATMAAVTRVRLDDLPLFADATLGRLDDYGRTVDALVADGVLVADPGGGIRPLNPALGARLTTDAGPGAVARLHRAYAAAMLRRAGTADRTALADHVAHAGTVMPTDRRTAASLAATAAEVTDSEPGRAADWLRAALWHAGGGKAADHILTRLLRLLIRTGQFARLAEVVRASASSGGSADLATAAALVAVHTGTRMPVPAGRGGPAQEAVSRLAERWLTGVAPGASGDGDGEFATVDRALGAGLRAGDGPADELLAAGTAGDLGTVLRLVLGGQHYTIPADGPLAAYHRLHRSYAAGDLAGMLSAAREVELGAGEAVAVRRLAHLWAAEALALRGRSDEAMTWLQAVPEEPPYAALRWWVANGPADEPTTAADAARRLRAARAAYDRQRAHGSRIGAEQLLVRAAALAARFRLAEHDAWLTALAAEEVSRRRISGGSELLVRALSNGDAGTAAAAVDTIRARGHRLELALATLALGRTASDPGPWLHAARAEADDLGVPWLRSAVTAAMRERDVRGSRRRAPRQTVSGVDLRIIDLIRQGRTNRQIAANLRMSEKTVENYLTRLFARTGCRSRVELAAASLAAGFAGAR